MMYGHSKSPQGEANDGTERNSDQFVDGFGMANLVFACTRMGGMETIAEREADEHLHVHQVDTT